MAYVEHTTRIIYNVTIGFSDPFSGAFVRGGLTMADDTEDEMLRTIARYNAYYKDRYGDTAYCVLVGRKDK